MPTPDTKYPLDHFNKNMVFLKNWITDRDIEVGDYTYYYSRNGAENFQTENVLLPYFSKLIIGKFCQISEGTTFVMPGANHSLEGFSTYPFFWVFQSNQYTPFPPPIHPTQNTVVGNDVWFGQNVTVLPGIQIGDGAVIGACAVVTKNIPPYTIVAGNPARIIRKRFSDDVIAELLEIQWWNWDHAKIMRNLSLIARANVQEFRSAQ